MNAKNLSSAQKSALSTIKSNPWGVLESAQWVAAKSLVRKGLVTCEVIGTYDARQVYGMHDNSRALCYTVRGALRTVTVCRYRAVEA